MDGSLMVLGIESSCDETCAGLVRGGRRHVAADPLEHSPLPDPCRVLIVSGGHTSLLLVRDLARDPIVHLGDTLDDAADACLDNVARVYRLPHPYFRGAEGSMDAAQGVMALLVRPVPGELLLSFAAGIRRVYAEAFAAHPWQEDEAGADRCLARLARDVVRPGFAVALALDRETVLGFATAWTTPDTFPSDRCYPQVSAALGPDRTADWLCGSREVDELAVAGQARGIGLGAQRGCSTPSPSTGPTAGAGC
ncbi:hypothetical protein [Streptomyces sp. NPDC050485]|uniref:hypothetical protein n=1 Tax=Streptomyces sp. NPDC050485 TaxID=3365617 RepID=UPI0037B3CA3C